MSANTINNQLYLAQAQTRDPGDGKTLAVEKSLSVCNLVSAGAETRTLGRPLREGVVLDLHMKTDGGDITLTITGGIDENGTTTYTFSDAGQFLSLKSFFDGTNYYWRKTSDYAIGNLLASQGGFSATAAEIDQVADISTRLVTLTTATETVAATYAGRTILLDTTHTQTVTLPQATGTGAVYRFVVKTKGTDGSKLIKVANATDIVAGVSLISNTDTTLVAGFATTATDDTVTLNNTTTGGFVGDEVEIEDIATGVFRVRITGNATGTVATPFSATVGS